MVEPTAEPLRRDFGPLGDYLRAWHYWRAVCRDSQLTDAELDAKFGVLVAAVRERHRPYAEAAPDTSEEGPMDGLTLTAGVVSVDEMLAGLASAVQAATEFMQPGPAWDEVALAVGALQRARERNTQGPAMHQGGPGHWGPYGPTVDSGVVP